MNTFLMILLFLYLCSLVFSLWGCFKLLKNKLNRGVDVTVEDIVLSSVVSLVPYVNTIASLALMVEYSDVLFDQNILKKVLFKSKSSKGE